MTKEEALKVLIKMRAWRCWGKGEQNEKDRPEMPEQKEVDEAFDVCIEMLSKLSLPSNLNEAAEEYVKTTSVKVWGRIDPKKDLDSYMTCANYGTGLLDGFKAGAVWQKEQNDKDLSEKIAAAYQLGLADKEKQMMSEAVECIVEDWNPEPHPEITIPLNPGKFSNGDRARIIIVKED